MPSGLGASSSRDWISLFLFPPLFFLPFFSLICSFTIRHKNKSWNHHPTFLTVFLTSMHQRSSWTRQTHETTSHPFIIPFHAHHYLGLWSSLLIYVSRFLLWVIHGRMLWVGQFNLANAIDVMSCWTWQLFDILSLYFLYKEFCVVKKFASILN